MANTFQGRDGKQGLAFLLDVENGTLVSGGSALAAGDIGFITAKGATSIFGDADVKTPFFAPTALTLASDDKFFKCTPYFLGFATSKSVSYSKETQDITCDYDVAVGRTNNVTDGVVTTSGSISGMNLLATGITNAINILKSRFHSITEIGSDGSVTVIPADTTNKDVIVIIWNFRDVKAADDIFDLEVLPVLFTSLSKGADYGSPQSFDLDFTANATDENGYIGGNLQVTRGASNPFAGWSVARA